MSRKSFRFDNAFKADPGLSMTFSRAIATRDQSGTTVASGDPRYGRDSILCSAPAVSTITGTTSHSWNVLATGVSYDNVTPVAVMSNITLGKLQVHLGAITLDGSGDATYQYSIPLTGSKNSYPDALSGSTDNNANEAWNPKGGTCCYGRVDLISTVGNNYDGSWRRNRVGVMSCNIEDLSGASTGWWRRTWLSPETPNNDTTDQTNMPTSWAVQNWSALAIDGNIPTNYIFCCTDYQSTSKLGGFFYVSTVSRPNSTDGTWTAGKFVQVLSFTRASSGGHCHGGLIVPDGDGGAKVVIGRGDGHANNCIYTAEIPDVTLYDNGASSEGGNSFNSYSGSTGITTPVICNGRIGGFTGSPPAVVDASNADEDYRRYGMQPVGIAQAGFGEEIVLGADEQHTAILMATSIPLTSAEGFTLSPVFRCHNITPVLARSGGQTATVNSSRLVLQITNRNSANVTSELLGQCTPQANNYAQDFQCHTVYSPDGERWCVAWNNREPEQAKPGFWGSHMIIGCPTGRTLPGTSTINGVRTASLPTYLEGRPLLVDIGGKNYFSDSCTVSKSSGMTNPGVSSTVNKTTALKAGYTTPVTGHTPIFFECDANNSSGSSSAMFVINNFVAAAGALPNGATAPYLTIQFQVYPAKVADWRSSALGSVDLPPPNTAEQKGSNSCSQGYRFRVRLNGATFTGYTENIYVTENDGSPRLVTIPIYIPSHIGTATGSYAVDLYVESTSIACPIKGWIVPVGAWASAIPGVPCAAGATAPDTSLAITGFNLKTTGWRAFWAGKVPTDPTWSMIHPTSYQTLTAANLTYGSATTTTLSGAASGMNATGAFVGHRLFGYVNSQRVGSHYGFEITSDTYTTSHALVHETHGQASGAWAADPTTSEVAIITAPGPLASAMPLFALTNSDASRRVAVYADTTTGKLKVRFYNGSWGSFASISNLYYMPEHPILVGLSYDGNGTITLSGSAGGTEVATATLSVTHANMEGLTKMIAGDGTNLAPAEWWGGMVDEAGPATASEATARLTNLHTGIRTMSRLNKLGLDPM